MDLEHIKEIIGVFDHSNLSKMDLDIEGLHLILEKGGVVPIGVSLPNVQQGEVQGKPVDTEKKETASEPPKKGESVLSGTEVKAPLVGVFYRAGSPDSAPFVKVGDRVKQGDTVCIIEAMKVMNEITAPCDGVVTVILPQDGDMVEFDQNLLVIS